VKRYGEACNALVSGGLKVLQQTARDRRNVFEQVIEAVKYNSLGQISHALYAVGGEYWRNM
jgi:isobutyryl-CoA mutase